MHTRLASSATLRAVFGAVVKTSALVTLSDRDRRIIELARAKLGAQVSFSDAMRALREATEELIPGGRVFFLGVIDGGPVAGSLVSGVGIVERESGIELVRRSAPIGWFAR